LHILFLGIVTWDNIIAFYVERIDEGTILGRLHISGYFLFKIYMPTLRISVEELGTRGGIVAHIDCF
jgi:hypothetical protein